MSMLWIVQEYQYCHCMSNVIRTFELSQISRYSTGWICPSVCALDIYIYIRDPRCTFLLNLWNWINFVYFVHLSILMNQKILKIFPFKFFESKIFLLSYFQTLQSYFIMQICRIKFFMLIKIQCRLRTFQKDVKIEYFISFSYISVQLFYHRYAQLFRCIFHRLVTFVFCIYEKSIFKDSLRFFKY